MDSSFNYKEKMARKSREVSPDYGIKFITDHQDAYIDFFWAIKTNSELPQNRVLIGLAQKLQAIMTGVLKLGTYHKGCFDYTHNYEEFQDLCNKSLNEIICIDNYERTYTGKQILEICQECKIR